MLWTAAILLLMSAPGEGALAASETGFEGAVEVLSEEHIDGYIVVMARVPYLDVYGEPAAGRARLVVSEEAAASGKLLPPFCHVHYEKPFDGAKTWADRGWAVSTAAYTGADGEYPQDVAVANGYNLSKAIIQWVRRLPFIDRNRLHIDGGSQGGYMALAMSAEFFPVASTTADAPVVNWAYNFNYVEANKAAAGYPDKLEGSPLPVLGMISMLADWAYKYYGDDLTSDTWYNLSPISYLDRITNPVMITAATGDMLVPLEQMRRDVRYEYDRDAFPENYQRDFDALTLNDKARVVFEDLVPEDELFIHWEPRQEESFQFQPEHLDPAKMPKERPPQIDRAFSKERQWSLFYMDEGPPAPTAPHTTYYWDTVPDSFVKYYRGMKTAPGILNKPKLERLMQRYTHQLQNLPLLEDGTPVNRLNFDYVEERDVLQGLLDYASLGGPHLQRLKALYPQIETRPFGDAISVEAIEAALKRAEHGQPDLDSRNRFHDNKVRPEQPLPRRDGEPGPGTPQEPLQLPVQEEE